MIEELPLPDPDTVFLLTDDIMTCPHCGSRTDWEDVAPLKQVHTCRNPRCRFTFHAEWDEDELDEDGNWVDPSQGLE
jgi:hypothetical protein